METSFHFYPTLNPQVHFPGKDVKKWEQYLSSRHAVLAELQVAPLAWVWHPDDDYEDQAYTIRCLVMSYPVAALSHYCMCLVCANMPIAFLIPNTVV